MFSTDQEVGFAVTPLADCPHCASVSLLPNVVLDPFAQCETCHNVGENMQCLTCFAVMCGRHVQSHMLQHHDATKHPLVIGFADLSIWCYPCESYIDSKNTHLSLTHRLLYNAKFNSEENAT